MSGPRYPAQGSGNFAPPNYPVDPQRYNEAHGNHRLSSVPSYPPGIPSPDDPNTTIHPWAAHHQHGRQIDPYNTRAVVSGEFDTASPGREEEDASQGGQSRRKPKSHVDKACTYCQKKHLACDVNRPCKRCIENGLAEQCISLPHKKRGRPPHANKDGRGGKPQRGTLVSDQASASSQYSSPGYEIHSGMGPQRPGNLPILPSQPHSDGFYHPGTSKIPAYYPESPFSPVAQHPMPPMHYNEPQYEHAPTAFLTCGLSIVRTTETFHEIISYSGGIQGRKLDDIVDETDLGTLREVATYIRNNCPWADDAREEHIPYIDSVDLQRVEQRFPLQRSLRLRHQPGHVDARFSVMRSDNYNFVMLTIVSELVQAMPSGAQVNSRATLPSPSSNTYHHTGPHVGPFATHPSPTAYSQHPRYDPGYPSPSTEMYQETRAHPPSAGYYDAPVSHRGYLQDPRYANNAGYPPSPYGGSGQR